MNASRHPSIDQIADLDAGLLPAAESSLLTAHLDECASCREVLTGLAEVEALLAHSSQQALPIPADVASAIDAALDRARAEDAAGVVSLAEHRTASEAGSGTDPARRRPARLLLGTAAAVAVFAVGGAVVDQLGLLSGSESDSTAAQVADQERGGNAGSGSNGLNPEADSSKGADNQSLQVPRSAAPTLDRNNAAAYAAGLDAAAVPVAKPPADCTPTNDEAFVSGGRTTESLVSFEGSRAVLRLDQQHREFTVYACPGPERVLYQSSY